MCSASVITTISVIIPAYNEQNSIEACLASVFANQFSSLECLIVDDGSTDSTLERCETLQSRYPSLKVLTKRHSGIADTRNLGLAHATGEFITFVDADDTLPSNALWLMYQTAHETDCDIVIGNQLRKDSLGRVSEPDNFKRWFQCRSNVSLADEPEALLSVSCWGKLYKSSFLKENAIAFPQGENWMEDVVFLYKALTRTDNFSCISDVVYYYHVRKRHEKNVTNQATLPHIQAVKRVLSYYREIFGDRDSALYRNIRDGRIKHSLAYHSHRNVLRNNDPRSFVELQKIVKSALEQLDPTAVTTDIRLNDVLDEIVSARNFRFLRVRFLRRHYTHHLFRLARNRTASYLSMLKRYIARLIAFAHPNTMFWTLKAGLAYLIVKIDYSSQKPIWLIGEREGISLNDNGYALFTYLAAHQSDVEPILVIRPALLPKIPEKFVPYTVEQGSLRHLIYCRIAEVCAYTHLQQEILCHPVYRHLSPRMALSGLRVFLGHGIIAIHNVPFYSYLNMKNRGEEPDLFIASSAKERDTIINHLGHLPESVAVTGMPRLDRLHGIAGHVSSSQKRILFIPTWRQSMEKKSASAFRRSQFFQSVRELLQSPHLIRFLDQKNLAVHWVVHHQCKKHFETLKTLTSSRVAVEHMIEADFQELLSNSLVLITDYSSISFDMASIKKPVIYFQFDQDDFLKARNGTSLNYDRDLPGPIVRNAHAVIQELEDLATRNFTQKAIYQDRAETFFWADAHNSRRVYEAIKTRLAETVPQSSM